MPAKMSFGELMFMVSKTAWMICGAAGGMNDSFYFNFPSPVTVNKNLQRNQTMLIREIRYLNYQDQDF
jgi:hypothetical protein